MWCGFHGNLRYNSRVGIRMMMMNRSTRRYKGHLIIITHAGATGTGKLEKGTFGTLVVVVAVVVCCTAAGRMLVHGRIITIRSR